MKKFILERNPLYGTCEVIEVCINIDGRAQAGGLYDVNFHTRDET